MSSLDGSSREAGHRRASPRPELSLISPSRIIGVEDFGTSWGAEMSDPTSVEIVEAFWDEVWNAHDPDAIDRFVVDDFVITTGGLDNPQRAVPARPGAASV